MSRILIVAQRTKSIDELCLSLTQKGYTCSLAAVEETITEQIAERNPDLILVESDTHTQNKELLGQIKQDKNLPIIVLLDTEGPGIADGQPGLIDDFVVKPYRLNELELRIKRLLLRRESPDGGEQIKCGDMIIDMAKCEVTVGGRPIMLTFKEFQLLKFLASSQGRVFTREALLNKVWGYEYYGGDRTVDVHIKRLRSKIEDANHSFIETVRNIGYRLRADI